MANTTLLQFRQHSLSQPIFQRNAPQTHGDVVQDKSASHSERSASEQPEHRSTQPRAFQLSSSGTRSQKSHTHASSFVPLTIHVPCMVRDEIDRRADTNAIVLKNGKRKSLSLSEVGRPIFTKGLQA